MGSVVGRISEETPRFTVVKKYSSFEVRHYAPRLVSQFTFHPDQGEGTDMAFRALARYIGVFATPENSGKGAPAKIAMTAPVVMGSKPEKVAMTAPVTVSSAQAPVLDRGSGDLSPEEKARRGPQVMQFNLPRSFTRETAPQPTNPRVEVLEVPAKFVAAVTFSGSFGQKAIDEQGRRLLEAMAVEGLKSAMADPKGYYCAGFNPPWTPPMFKTNEVYVDIQPEPWMDAKDSSSEAA